MRSNQVTHFLESSVANGDEHENNKETSAQVNTMTDEAGSKKEARGGGIQSLDRAAAILQAVSERPQGIGLAELSAQVGLHTSTAFHLTKTLVRLGFLIQQIDSKRYQVGSRLFALAAGALNDNTLLSLATPVLERLSSDTGEASHLAIRSRHDVVLIARVAATGMLQMSQHMGVTRPPHATAIGKVLLAFMSPAERKSLIDQLLLPQLTPHTITDPKLLLRELELVEQQGVAHDRCEFDSEVRCLAMPVYDFAGRCIAAIGISGPIWRMTPTAVENKSHFLSSAATNLSQRLGDRSTPPAK